MSAHNVTRDFKLRYNLTAVLKNMQSKIVTHTNSNREWFEQVLLTWAWLTKPAHAPILTY